MKTFLKISTTITFIAMVVVNSLANILPINNTTTGQVSDAYPNIFAPAGITFSIWGLIYLLLAIYTIYQFTKNKEIFNKINPYFLVSSLANIAWIFAWHYQLIPLSALLIVIILICLIKIADIIKVNKLDSLDKKLIRLPFSIYFGWITVAVIANITVLLVSLNWNQFNLSEEFWTVTIIIIATIIGITRMIKDQNIPYGLVFVWAYLGIFIKQSNSEYFYLIATTIFCIAIFLSAQTFLLLSNSKTKNK